jgi:hypothetical protein
MQAALFGVSAFVLLCFLILTLPLYAEETGGLEVDAVPDLVERQAVDAPPIQLTPIVINEKAKARDIIKKDLLITNNTSRKLNLYISVENIDPNRGSQPFVSPGASDLSTSLANWIEITRGVVELGAGESRRVPYLIHVNLSAKPGVYFAEVTVREGSTRAQAEASDNGPRLLVNLEVMDDARERLQLGQFTTDSSVVLGSSISFSYLLENTGNRLLEPRGSIRIFNRRGEEVGSVPVNADGEEITPQNKKQLAAAWSASGRFGKYKAFLDLEYGENQLASVQDTLYFWVFPWKEVFAALIGVLVLGVFGTVIIHLRTVASPVRANASVRYDAYADSDPEYYAPQPQRRSTPTQREYEPPAIALAPTRPGMPPRTQQSSVVRLEHQQGPTVMLSPRGRGGAKTQGSTVTLSSRR